MIDTQTETDGDFDGVRHYFKLMRTAINYKLNVGLNFKVQLKPRNTEQVRKVGLACAADYPHHNISASLCLPSVFRLFVQICDTVIESLHHIIHAKHGVINLMQHLTFWKVSKSIPKQWKS